MARPTKASAAPLRAKLKAEAAKRGRPKGLWTPEIVTQRIQISKIMNRLERQALGELTKKTGEQATMTRASLDAAHILVDRCIPKAQAPIDLSVSGSITVIRRDPTQRPADYQRKGKASI